MQYTEHRKSDQYLAARGSASLPSVEEWLAHGGEIERPTDAPRPEFTMQAFNSRNPLAPRGKLA